MECAFSATSAQLNSPSGLAVDAAGAFTTILPFVK
jgi:hypothetical protein